MSPNPSIGNPSASSVLLQWVPPYLWPGQVIDYYTVSVTGEDGIRTVHHMNATYNDTLVLFTETVADNTQQVQNCSKMIFTLSAVKTYEDGLCTNLASFTIEGGFVPGKLCTSLSLLTVYCIAIKQIHYYTMSYYIQIIPTTC